MEKIKVLISWLILCFIIIFSSCEKIINIKNGSDLEESPDDYDWDTSTVVMITLNNSSVTVNPPVAEVEGSKLTIVSAGTYSITGTLTNGQIIVNTSDEGNVRLIMNGVNISSHDSAPIYIKKARKTIIILSDSSQNYLSDGTSFIQVDGEPDATLFSNSYLAISGEGKLTVTANINDGISSDDELILKSGNFVVSSADDGIRGKDYLQIDGGIYTINSTGDGLKSDNDEDVSLGYINIEKGEFHIMAGKGDGISAETTLTISDGSFDITTGSGASATSSTTTSPQGGGLFPPGGGGTSGGYSGTISEKAVKSGNALKIITGTFTINSADDAIHSNSDMTIEDGSFSIASGDDGIHADEAITINGGEININKCYEGIESASITVNTGNIMIASTDDAINATKGSATEMNDGSCLYVNGGLIAINASSGDGLDSNGNIEMNSGTVIVHGPQSSPEVGFDVNGTFNISGGLLVASGPNSGNMIEVPSNSSAQYSVKATINSNLSASTLFHMQDEKGTDILTFKPIRNIYYIVVSSPELKSGSTYSIYTGGICTGTDISGLYTDGDYSGGTLRKTFTITAKNTSVSF